MTQERLEYLSGFFDGDGCVTFAGKMSSCSLSLSQSFDRSACLLHFRESFGGGVYRKSGGLGMRKPTLQWAVSGATGRSAAEQLSQWPSMKSPQLRIAASWPECTKIRAELAQQLKVLKGHQYTPKYLQCSWPYLAGFFDAEGHIRVAYNSVSIHLSLAQKNRAILDCVASL